jgi:hypothetical protein
MTHRAATPRERDSSRRLRSVKPKIVVQQPRHSHGPEDLPAVPTVDRKSGLVSGLVELKYPSLPIKETCSVQSSNK